MNLDDLADRYGTPAYTYDLARVRAAHADLRAALPAPSSLYYSVKANPHPRLVTQLARLGCRAEVCSEGEIQVALCAGMAPADVLLTGPGKTARLIEYALHRQIRRFSVDSPTDLARVGELARRHGVDVDCLLRVNADQPVSGMGLAMTGTASQFGADASWVAARPERFRASGRARVVGLHLYMGTNLAEEGALLSQFETAAALAARLGPAIGGLAEVDLGGGFGTPYAAAGVRPVWPGLRTRLAQLLDRYLPGWRSGRPGIAFESGRYLVGDCGVLLCRVLDVKRSKGQLFAVLDAGVNHLGGMVGLRRLPPIVPTVEPVAGRAGDDPAGPSSPPVPSTAAVPSTPLVPSTPPVPTTVVGPLCTPLDTFVRGAAIPALRPGQLVRVGNVGAYGLTASLLAFLGHPSPVEVVVDGDTVLDVSRLRLSRAGSSLPDRPAALDSQRSVGHPPAATRPAHPRPIREDSR